MTKSHGFADLGRRLRRSARRRPSPPRSCLALRSQAITAIAVLDEMLEHRQAHPADADDADVAVSRSWRRVSRASKRDPGPLLAANENRGPGSAAHHFVLRRARDTRGESSRPAAVLLQRVVARRVGDLVEPVEAHLLDDAVRHHDQPAVLVVAGDVLVVGERRDVDVVAALPGIRLRLGAHSHWNASRQSHFRSQCRS